MSTTSSRIEPTMSHLTDFSLSHVQTAEAPKSRKLGRHYASELEPPNNEPSSDREENSGNTTSEEDGGYLEKQHHHGSRSNDKSIVGGGVILGGLVMAFVLSIVCYIRATKRRSALEPPTPTTVNSKINYLLFASYPNPSALPKRSLVITFRGVLFSPPHFCCTSIFQSIPEIKPLSLAHAC
ncbi:hypothetical protein L6452_03893 [Arctium lappa]|uniref:Uncharacterized protein n=1 Tax=Arctium lappa TaxID=4217 RepID=A0ACB9FNZ3_ARCLA|nr:hypothetical protein L6452_03893 [Arctium lappa]